MFQIGNLYRSPLSGKQSLISGAEESLIEQHHYPSVILRPDNSSRSLENLVHPGIHVGILISGPGFVARSLISVIEFPQNIMLQVNSRYSGPDTDHADQGISLKIYTLREHTAHNTEAYQGVTASILLRSCLKARKEVFLLRFRHIFLLQEQLVTRCKECSPVYLIDPVHIGIGWEKYHVIALFGSYDPRDMIRCP